MNQQERRRYLIDALLGEKPEYRGMKVPQAELEQRKLLRSLMNVRWAAPTSAEFERIQDEYLQKVNRERGIVDIENLEEREPDMYIWQGDITRLRTGAIVNAANSGMTGCYQPCHACIDNCIHTYSGVQLRNFCQKLMDEQGCEEPAGRAKVTPAFNLPCDCVIHTVGPIVYGELTEDHERLLASCYESCLRLADKNGLGSIAFCCISTGIFHFPNDRAAEIAVDTVRKYKERTGSRIKVIYNVFKDLDREIYEKLLGDGKGASAGDE